MFQWRFRPERLKRQILLPVAAIGVVVLGLFIYAFNHVFSRTAEAEYSRDAEALAVFWQQRILQGTDHVNILATSIAGSVRVQELMAQGAIAELHQEAGPVLRQMIRDHRLDSLLFTDAGGRVLLRVHDPARFGDLFDVPVFSMAREQGLPQAAIDICQLGVVSLRAAAPIRAGTELVGYVLLSTPVRNILLDLDALFGQQHLLLINTEYLRQRNIKPRGGEGDIPTALQGLPRHAVASSSLSGVPTELIEALQAGRIPQTSGLPLYGRSSNLQLTRLPLHTATGVPFGDVLALRDISASQALFHQAAILISATVIGLGGLVFLFLYRVTHRAQGQLVGFYDRLFEAHRQLEQVHRDWMDSIDAIREPIFLHDEQHRVIRANKAYAEAAGMRFDELLGRPYWEVFPKREGPLSICTEAPPGGEQLEMTLRESEATYLARAFPLYDENGRYRFSVHIFEDITAHEQVTQALQREIRAHRTVSRSNQALIHARDEQRLLEDICSIATEVGGYKVAWVAYVQHDLKRTLEPRAAAGVALDELLGLGLSWGEGEQGNTPAALAVRSGEVQFITDIGRFPDPQVRALAMRSGCRAAVSFPLKVYGNILGTLTICGAAAAEFEGDEMEVLGELAADLAFGIMALRSHGERERAVSERGELLRKLETSLQKTVQAMATALELRDPYTAGHQRRVAALAVAIGEELGLPQEQLEALRIAGILHDIGKIHVPSEILSKPGRLTAVEYELVKSHAAVSYELLKDIDFPWPVADIVHQHHERLDGSGYPRGLKGAAILPEARILAVADVVEAMATHRPYRPGLSIDVALAEIIRLSGSGFDPQVVEACVRLFRQRRFHLPDEEGQWEFFRAAADGYVTH